MTTLPTSDLDAFLRRLGVESLRDAADRCQVNAQTIARARQRGVVELETAERIAHHLGEHPSYIWDTYYDVIAAWADEVDARKADQRDRYNARRRQHQANLRARRWAA